MPLKINLPEECRWDAVALGEVMLRLDPGQLQEDDLAGDEGQRRPRNSRLPPDRTARSPSSGGLPMSRRTSGTSHLCDAGH